MDPYDTTVFGMLWAGRVCSETSEGTEEGGTLPLTKIQMQKRVKVIMIYSTRNSK